MSRTMAPRKTKAKSRAKLKAKPKAKASNGDDESPLVIFVKKLVQTLGRDGSMM